MTEAPELRRARFHLLRAEDALAVAIAGVRAVPVPDSVRVMLTDHACVVQLLVQELLGLLGPAQPGQAGPGQAGPGQAGPGQAGPAERLM